MDASESDQRIHVTSGATEALFAAIAAVVRPDDEVIVLDPCYDSYEPAIELTRRAVHVPLDPHDFSPDCSACTMRLQRRRALILVNSPPHPVRRVFTPADLDALAELTRERAFWCLSMKSTNTSCSMACRTKA